MQIAIRRRVTDCAEGTQHRVLLYAGDPAEIPDVHKLSQVGARDLLEKIDDLLITLRMPRLHNCEPQLDRDAQDRRCSLNTRSIHTQRQLARY